jgi:hypothetical protein
MTERRFTDKPDLDPTAVRSLPEGHPALVENRTLFPTTVVVVDENFEDRLLVSGRENRKLGETVAKGKFKGYALYGLSLEERATCPTDCSVRSFCYGNGMQLARRHRIGDFEYFALLLENEIREIIEVNPAGLLVRLHVLGDFPDVEYVAMWADLLDGHPKLACYGYTHRRSDTAIGKAIQSIKDRFPDRFRIRWSHHLGGIADSATIIQRVPLTPKVAEGLVCPAQTDATACCASCGLCWEPSAKKETIVFIKHGPKSLQTAAEAERDGDASDTRRVQPIALPSAMKPNAVAATIPQLRMVKPRELRIEAAYQRDLSGRSVKLIRKIVTGWDWAKFKPPICAETPDGLVVIDGQHTAIAAATHPGITEMPVMVCAVAHLERRAAAFVSHNRDRLMMTPAQIFYGEVAAKEGEARLILERVARAGGSIPKLQVQRGAAKPGQITAVGELRAIFKHVGPTVFERIIRIAVASKIAPISQTPLRAIQMILSEPAFADIAKKGDAVIAAALGSIENLEGACQFYAAETGQGRYRACVGLIAKAAEGMKVAA